MARTYLLRHLVCRVILLIKHSDHRCAPKILGVHVPVAKLEIYYGLKHSTNLPIILVFKVFLLSKKRIYYICKTYGVS